MKLMTCNTCFRVVEVNNTGVCLGCQIHSGCPQADVYDPQNIETLKQKADSIQKEIDDSLEREKQTRPIARATQKKRQTNGKTKSVRNKIS